MSEQPPQAEPASAPSSTGDEQRPVQPSIVIGAQYIKDLSFENPLGPEALASLTEAPNVEVEVTTNVRDLGQRNYEVVLLVRGEAKANAKTVFIVELTYGGIVSVNGLAEESLQPVLAIDAPRHLFPFARAIIANTTREGGFPPVMINPIDFAALYLQQHGAPQAQ